jgi:DNA-binding MarR family transcriptional regulator
MSDKNSPPDVARLIMRASRAQFTVMMTRLAERGFEDFPSAFTAVIPVLDDRGTRSTVLAQRMRVTKQAMSQLVRIMERRKYAEQVPDPMDARAKVVRLTKRGEAVKKALAEIREELNNKAMNALGRQQMVGLHNCLNQVVALLTLRL